MKNELRRILDSIQPGDKLTENQYIATVYCATTGVHSYTGGFRKHYKVLAVPRKPKLGMQVTLVTYIPDCTWEGDSIVTKDVNFDDPILVVAEVTGNGAWSTVVSISQAALARLAKAGIRPDDWCSSVKVLP